MEWKVNDWAISRLYELQEVDEDLVCSQQEGCTCPHCSFLDQEREMRDELEASQRAKVLASARHPMYANWEVPAPWGFSWKQKINCEAITTKEVEL